MQSSILATAAPVVGSALSRPAAASIKPFELEEATVAELQRGMQSGKYSARSIAEKYLERIEEVDKRGPAINSVIEINPEATAATSTVDLSLKGGAEQMLPYIDQQILV